MSKRREVRIAPFAVLAVVLGTSVISPKPSIAQGGVPQPDGFQYYWPGACVTAIQRSDAFYWRARQDTLPYDPAADTMLAVSSKLAQECIAQIKDSALAPRDYVPLARAYLAVNDDQAALALVGRRLSLPDVKTSGPRAWVLADIVQGLLNASLPRVDAAKIYLTQLNALRGAEAAVGKVRAYRALATYYWRIGDIPNLTAASERLIAVGKELNDHDRREFQGLLFFGYRYLAEIEAAKTGDSTAARAVMDKAMSDIGSVGAQRLIRNYITLLGLYGTQAAPVKADRWIAASPADTVHPTDGKFTLVAFRPFRGNTPALSRIARDHRDRLNVVGVLGTIGYFRDLGPLTPQLEAEELRKYFLEDLQISWPIALNFIEYTRMPDGRRNAEPSPNEAAYRSRSGATLILIDPAGVIRRVWVSWDKSYENRVAEALRELGGQ